MDLRAEFVKISQQASTTNQQPEDPMRASSVVNPLGGAGGRVVIRGGTTKQSVNRASVMKKPVFATAEWYLCL